MAIPDSPLTRTEQYLNRIATGDDLIPDVPLSRVEQYLDYIAKNGDGSESGTAVHSYQYNPDNSHFDSNVLFQRVGNVVEVRYIGKLTLEASKFIEISNFAPAGFKPSDPTTNKSFPVCLLCFVPNGNNGRFLFRLFKDGKLSMYNYGGAMTEGMFYMSGTYTTEDDMPST